MDTTRILIIDDNVDDLDLLSRELKRSMPQAKLSKASESAEANTAITKGEFDIVILDYKLRWSDGIEILKQIKAAYPTIPVIMLTGTGTEEVAVQAMKLGLDDYIIKSARQLFRVTTAIKTSLESARRKRDAHEVKSTLSAIVEGAEDAIYSVNRDKKISSWNCGAENMFGYAAQEVVGQPLTKLIPLERHNEIATIDDLLNGTEKHLRIESLRIRKDGSLLQVSVSSSPIRDESGKIVGVSRIVRDITERKKFEAAMRESEASVDRANKILKISANISRNILMSGLANADEAMSIVGKKLNLQVVLIHNIGNKSQVFDCWIVDEKNPHCHIPVEAGVVKSIKQWIMADTIFLGTPEWMPEFMQFAKQIHAFELVRSLVIIPIHIKSPWGLIGFGSEQPLMWSATEVDALSSLANLLALISHNVQKEEELREHIAKSFKKVEKINTPSPQDTSTPNAITP